MELAERINNLDGKSLLDNGISTVQLVGLTGVPANRTFIWHAIETQEIAEKVLVDGVAPFHSEEGLKVIQEAMPLWKTKNRGFFQTMRNPD